jgi:uncharacterized membrane protein YedE/YeeE
VRALAGLAAGLLFGLGLALSGMMNPVRVLGFLDVAGKWDPSLAFVLAGAVAVSTAGVLIARRRAHPAFAARFNWPDTRGIDRRLVLGAMVFGVGWGLAGFCPGPAIAALTLGYGKCFLFAAAMLAGMALHRVAILPRPARGQGVHETQ